MFIFFNFYVLQLHVHFIILSTLTDNVKKLLFHGQPVKSAEPCGHLFCDSLKQLCHKECKQCLFYTPNFEFPYPIDKPDDKTV